MLIIGHRGGAGLEPENTLASLRAGIAAGADMLEFDIRLTKDKVPVLAHDFHLYHTHKSSKFISSLTLKELQKMTAKSDNPIATLDEAMQECYGKVLLAIELKQTNMFEHALPVLEKYIKRKTDWQSVLFLSFKPRALRRVRKLAPHAQLALTHSLNPFLFVGHVRPLALTAVGFHRLRVDRFAVELAKQLGLFTYVYTVNRPDAAFRLAERGIDGIVTDRPDLLMSDKRLKRKRA